MLKQCVAFIVMMVLTVGFAQTDSSGTVELPGEAVFPEGIAYDAASGSFFVGSASEGTIFRGDAETGDVTILVAGGQRAAFSTLGLEVDQQKRLWVAGGSSGQIYAYDIATGEQTLSLGTPPAEATFLNDLAVSAGGDVYVTDSNRPILFKVAAEAKTAEPWLDFSGTVFEYQEGTNANGIVITPDDQYLLVVQMDTGQLYRIEVASREVTEIDLGGEALTGADGLVLDGQTLYAVLQPTNEVAVVTLAEDFASGTVAAKVGGPMFRAPATAALVGDELFVVNTQFDKLQSEPGPELPFTVSRVPLSNFSSGTAQ